MLPDKKQKNLEMVLDRFRDLDENDKWTKIDDYMLWVDYMDDEQLCMESSLLYEKHKYGDLRCRVNHKAGECLVPFIVEAVDSILDVYEDMGTLNPDSRYILQYYVTLTATGDILS